MAGRIRDEEKIERGWDGWDREENRAGEKAGNPCL